MKKALQVLLDESLHQAAKIKSAETGIPMGEICRRALRGWIKPIADQDEKQPE